MPYNLQPILDLVGKTGELTSEYKTARTAGRAALLMFAIGLIVMLAGLVSNIFGETSKVGVIAGAISAIAAIVSKAMISSGYSAARADAKTAAASIVAAATAPAAPTDQIVVK